MRRSVFALLGAVIGLGVAGCSSGASRQLTPVTVAMGYIPNVQFAPFYVAQALGYYRQAGLTVHFQYGIEPDLLRLAAEGKVNLVNTGGDEVISAGAEGLGVTYVMTQYTRFPTAVFALRSSGIRRVSDLRGRSIGLPGLYGASYVGVLALLRANGMVASNVHLSSIGYTQVAAVLGHRVAAAVGYATNEPVELRTSGHAVTEFDVYHWANIAGAGIAVGNAYLAGHPARVRAFIRATVQGMQYTLAHPAKAFAIAEQAVPTIRAQATLQRAVFQRSLDFWKPISGHPIGWSDPTVWNLTARLLYQYHQIPHAVAAQRFHSNAYLP